MIEPGDLGRGAERMIRTREVGRLPGGAAACAANDNRTGPDRRALPLARSVLGTARAPRLAPTHGPGRTGPLPAAPFAWWMPGSDAFYRLPPVATTLACVRAWSELGMLGAVGCTSLVAAGAELAGLVVGGFLTAATAPALVLARPSAPRG